MKNEDKQLHVRLPEEIYKKLKLRCVHEDTSMQEYVAKLITESLRKDSSEELSHERKTRRKSIRRH